MLALMMKMEQHDGLNLGMIPIRVSEQKPLMQFFVIFFDETITLYDRDDLRGAYVKTNYDRPKDRHAYDRKEP